MEILLWMAIVGGAPFAWTLYTYGMHVGWGRDPEVATLPGLSGECQASEPKAAS